MAYYGVGDGWCFAAGGFAGHVKLMFIHGATVLDPVPPVTPIGMGKATRGVELEALSDLDRSSDPGVDETGHVCAWHGQKAHLTASQCRSAGGPAR